MLNISLIAPTDEVQLRMDYLFPPLLPKVHEDAFPALHTELIRSLVPKSNQKHFS